MVILIDVDDCMWGLLRPWLQLLNERYGTDVQFDDVVNFDMREFFPTLSDEEIYGPLSEEILWDKVQPNFRAGFVTEQLLCDGHDLRFVTAAHYSNVLYKFNRFEKLFPFVGWERFIITRDKSLIMGDVILDDWKNNLLSSPCEHKFIMDMPHNRSFNNEANGIYRVAGWLSFYDAILKLRDT